MSNRNLRFILITLAAIAAAGYLVDWWLACGIFVGLALMLYVFTRRFSVYDDLESQALWYGRRGWRDQPPGEDNPYWSEIWRPLLILLALAGVLATIVFGLI